MTRSSVNPQISVYTAFTAPVRRLILERSFILRKLEKIGYQLVKNFDDTFNHFDMIPELLRETGGRNCYTDIAFCIASHADER